MTLEEQHIQAVQLGIPERDWRVNIEANLRQFLELLEESYHDRHNLDHKMYFASNKKIIKKYISQVRASRKTLAEFDTWYPSWKAAQL